MNISSMQNVCWTMSPWEWWTACMHISRHVYVQPIFAW